MYLLDWSACPIKIYGYQLAADADTYSLIVLPSPYVLVNMLLANLVTPLSISSLRMASTPRSRPRMTVISMIESCMFNLPDPLLPDAQIIALAPEERVELPVLENP